MPSPIENAREALQKGLTRLPAAGLRTDYALTLKRYPDAAADELNMDPTIGNDRGAPQELVIEAPDVQPVSLGAIQVSGGVVKAGDLLVKLVRTAAVEAFLKVRLDNPGGITGGPYPEGERVEFWINGEPHRPIYWRPRAMTVKFTVRKHQ